MLGDTNREAPLWSYRVNLEKRVRPDHPLRRIKARLDLDFVRSQVAHTYGRRGNKSVPPEVIVKMLLLLFLEDIKSERELMRIIPERLDYMWFLDYGLDEEIPNHSVLSKARKRWGKEVFVSLFSRVVQQCVSAGLVKGEKIHLDSSLVDANAALGSVKPLSPEMIQAIEAAARQEMEKLDEAETEPEQPPPREPPGGGGANVPGQFAKANRQFRSTTDPEASLVRQSGLKSRPRYKSHRAVDDLVGIITAVETTTGAVDEGSRLQSLIEAHEDTTQEKVKIVIADARYGNVSNLIACCKAGIRPHLKLLGDSHKGKGRSAGIYPEELFRYQPQSDTYLCPAGQRLRPRRCHPKRLTFEYVTAKGVCLACPLRAQCTRSGSSRTIHRHKEQAWLSQGRQIARSEQSAQDLRRRGHFMERSFADAANNHGFKRARWRALWKQTIQDLLIATVQNLRKLIKHLQNGSLEDLSIPQALAYCGWLLQSLTHPKALLLSCCQ
jgi:transposase